MGRPNGIHHLAIATNDIKSQIDFFTRVLGMELVALYWMHGAEGYFHAFLRLSDHSSIAFVQGPGIARAAPIPGVTRPGFTAGPVAPGAMQHVAFNVDSEADLLAMRDRARAHGCWVLGPVDHGMCLSMYLAAPEGIMLEFATSAAPVDAEAWIDPEVVDLCGISADELARYKNPPPFASCDGRVPQPTPGQDGAPQFDLPAPLAERLYAMSDEEIAQAFSVTEPPVTPPAAAARRAR